LPSTRWDLGRGPQGPPLTVAGLPTLSPLGSTKGRPTDRLDGYACLFGRARVPVSRSTTAPSSCAHLWVTAAQHEPPLHSCLSLCLSLSMLRPLKGTREMRFRVRRAAVHTIFVCPRKACNRLMHFDGRCHFWLVSTQVGTCIGGLGLHRLNIHEQAK
jgi:hypothetical protein